MNRAERRRLQRERAKAGGDRDVCVQMGCTADEDLADLIRVKKATHDLCIKQAGPYRTSGVKWLIGHGDWARRVADDALRTAHPHDVEVYRSIKRWLAEHPRARLVVASCEIQAGAPHPFEAVE